MIFDRLHIPVAISKLEGPTERLTFLGTELDTQAMILCLPASKLDELRLLVAQWQGKKFCRKKDLQSLVGKLQQAYKVVHPGGIPGSSILGQSVLNSSLQS